MSLFANSVFWKADAAHTACYNGILDRMSPRQDKIAIRFSDLAFLHQLVLRRSVLENGGIE